MNEIIVWVATEIGYDCQGYPVSQPIYKPQTYNKWMRKGVWKHFKNGMIFMNDSINFDYRDSDYILETK